MNVLNELLEKKTSLSVIGLGYVGMPIAVSFSNKVNVIGFDISSKKIDLYKKGIDPTKEVGDDVIKRTSVIFTYDEKELSKAKFHIVAVPTPVNSDHIPDLEPLKSASVILGRNLKKGSIVVYESTVYPGVTEDICIPILEFESGLKLGIDFKVGYSPERINPGDKVHRLETIIKVVSGTDRETLNEVAKVYELVVTAGVFKAESIKVAEAAKVIENSQRDINIAFMNELSIIFNKIGIDTKSVLEAAGTKWNFLNFSPGLVGGHCIGVDPYYLTYKAQKVGYQSQVILSGRKINDAMGKYVSENIIKLLILEDISIKNAKVAIFGFTFKENCPDTRNTRVVDIYNELRAYNINAIIIDPIADQIETEQEYGLKFHAISDIFDIDVLVFAVSHDIFRSFTISDLMGFYKRNAKSKKILIDVKSIFDKSEVQDVGITYFRL